MSRPFEGCRTGPRQPKKDNHFAALPYAAVPEFLEKLGGRESVGRVALEALILTVARSGEIRGAAWSELNLKTALWTIPAARMKMGRAHVVPLPPEAVAEFERAEKFKAGASDLVFPGQNVKKPLSDMTLLKILRDMDLAVTVHGFPPAFRDRVAEQTDYSGEIAEAALAQRFRTRWKLPTAGPTSSTSAAFSCGTGQRFVKRLQHPRMRSWKRDKALRRHSARFVPESVGGEETFWEMGQLHQLTDFSAMIWTFRAQPVFFQSLGFVCLRSNSTGSTAS